MTLFHDADAELRPPTLILDGAGVTASLVGVAHAPVQTDGFVPNLHRSQFGCKCYDYEVNVNMKSCTVVSALLVMHSPVLTDRSISNLHNRKSFKML